MTRIATLTILLFLLGGTFFARGQEFSRKGEVDTTELYINQADELFEQGKYYAAANLYGKAVIDKKTPYVLHRLATANRKGRFYSFSELWYKELLDTFPEAYQLDKFWYGKMLKASGGQYKKAQKVFREFKDEFSKSAEAETYNQYKRYLNEAKEEIKACEYAMKINQTMSERSVFNIGNEINKKESEFAAVQRNPKILLFSGAQKIPSTHVKKFLFITINKSYDTLLLNRVYRSKKKKKQWQERSPLHIPMKDPNQDIGGPAFTPDNKGAFFTLCKGSYGNQVCHLYHAKTPTSGKWFQPTKLPKPLNTKKSSSKNPTVAVINGDTILFFASNREGGEGQFDIWYSKKDASGEYLPPQNLGDHINTPRDEVTPFYYEPEGALYFSSDGHPTLGQYDIFKVKGSPDKGWDSVRNIGPPVNGPADNYYFSKFKNNGKEVAYFSSNRRGGFSRQGTCCDDIYFFTEKVAPTPTTEKRALSVFDALSKRPLPNFTLEMNQPDTTVQVTNSHQFTYESGQEEQNMTVYKPNYLPKTHSTSKTTKTTPTDSVFLQKAPLPTIHYDFNKAELSPDEKDSLQPLVDYLNDYPEAKLVVASHTDNVDKWNYNIQLSKQRTETIINYFQEQGVSSEQLIGQWYGESKPIAPNKLESGEDNPEGRAQNRRSSFQLIYDTAGVPRGRQAEEKPVMASKEPSPTPARAQLNLSRMAFETILQKYGTASHPDITFKIQVGAYQTPQPNMFDHLTDLGTVTTDTTTQGVIKFMIGRTSTLQEAARIKKQAKEKGVEDAWMVAYDHGKRIGIRRAIEKLVQK